jgi:Cu+-exporting ATPase
MEQKERPKFAKDPVCGMAVNVDKAAGTSTYDGKTFYFCSPGCKQKFDANPAGYASGSIAPQKMG